MKTFLRHLIDKVPKSAHRFLAFSVLVLPTQKADIEIDAFELIEREKGQKKLEIIAPHAKLYRKEELAGLRYPSTRLWNDKNKPFLVQSDEGIVDTQSKNIQMHGNCVVTSPQLYQLKTEELFYNESLQSIEGSKEITLHNKLIKEEKASFQLTGQKLLALLKENKYVLEGGIQALQKNKQGQIQISAEKATLFPDQDLGIVEENIEFQSQDISLSADRLSFYFHPKNSSSRGLKKIYLESLQNKRIQSQFAGFEIKSKGMNLYPSAKNKIQRVEAVGQVEAVHENGTRIKSESLKLENAQSKNPKTLLKGDVEISYDGKIARCQDAEYFPLHQKVKLKNLASIQMGQEKIQGEEINFSMKDSKIEVKNASGQISRESLGL